MTGALKVRTATGPDVWTTIAGGVTTFASDAEVVAGVETSKAVSPATLKTARTPATAITAAPSYVGQVAVVGTAAYIAVGVAAPTDWKVIT